MQRRAQLASNNSSVDDHPHQDNEKKYHNHGHKGSSSRMCARVLVAVLLCGGALSLWASPYYDSITGTSSASTLLSNSRLNLANNQDPESIDASNWPLIHIVHTRFMQEQSQLHALANARFGLFEVFCMPTMVQQSTQRFLWIIQADPHLETKLLQRLQALLQPYPNYYLVLSNQNFRINRQFPGAWRGGAETRALRQANILTGSRTLLNQATAASDSKHILETRLDADDGLHIDYLHHIQERALHKFQAPDNQIRWTYWCARRHMEWHWMDGSAPSSRYGVLAGIKHDNLCITPGITVGFPIGTKEADVPIFAHDKIVVTLRDMPTEDGCGTSAAIDCLEFIETHIFEAIRSRTPTSAGMLHVDLTHGQVAATSGLLAMAYWDTLHDLFRLDRQRIRRMNEYLTENLIDIAKDNLYGQCTTGHSCKVCHHPGFYSTLLSCMPLTAFLVSIAIPCLFRTRLKSLWRS
jgi:hypothetical protein